MKARKFIHTWTLSLIFFTTGYFLIFFIQLGTPVETFWWANELYEYKEHRVGELENPKVMIFSGSNSHYGINSELLEKELNMPVVNMAIWLDLDLRFFFFQLKNHLKEGDIVVMPLEFSYYSREKMTKKFSSEMMIWGGDAYISKLSPIELLDFIINSEPQRIFTGLWKKLFPGNSGGSEIALMKKKIAARKEELFSKSTIQWNNNEHLIINKHGDMIADYHNTTSDDASYLTPKKSQPSTYFLKRYKRIERYITENKATLVLTYPVTVRDQFFNLTRNEAQVRVKRFENNLQQNGIEIRCNAAWSNIDRTFIYNSVNHLNKYGAIIRTTGLAKCINNIRNNHFQPASYDEVFKTVQKLEQQYSAYVREKPEDFFPQRLKDLTQLKKALENYFKDFGKYPVSKGFDGLYSKWGYEGVNWITGLTPKYLKVLPNDPRKNKIAAHQYLYKSDGNDYKLIAHGPEDCKKVRVKNPHLIDPARDCHAYGFWTVNAENW